MEIFGTTFVVCIDSLIYLLRRIDAQGAKYTPSLQVAGRISGRLFHKQIPLPQNYFFISSSFHVSMSKGLKTTPKMPPENAPVLYTDDGARFGGREYPGCFSINEVRQRLGQPLLEPVDASTLEVCPDAQGEMVTAESHFLPNCACAALHAACGSSYDENDETIESKTIGLSLKQLRESSEVGCWFCTVIYGGIMAAPPWDTESKAKRPSICEIIHLSDNLNFRPYDLSISAFKHLDDPYMIEPDLVFYVDEDEGKASAIVVIIT